MPLSGTARNAIRRALPAVLGILAFFAIAGAANAASQPLFLSPDAGTKRPQPFIITPALKDYCRLLYGCSLPVPSGACPALGELGFSPFPYDSARCSEARTFNARGLGPDDPAWGFRLYRFLGAEYRIIYEVTDTLPLSRERLEYLIGDVPLAARLVSHYQPEIYTATYVDAARKHFKGTKGKNLRGEAVLVSGSFAERRLYYFGTGVAEVAFWTLSGPAMMDFSYWDASANGVKRTGYKLKILVFPGNSVINTIMNLGLFRGIVNTKIHSVLTDISETAGKMQKDGGKDLLRDPTWSAADKKKIETLLQLP